MEAKLEGVPVEAGAQASSAAGGAAPAASASQPMSAQEPSVAPAPEPSKETTVEQAVRKIVQNEIRKGPPPAESAAKRSKWDFFWLMMLIASVGLTVTYIHGLLERPELKTLLELLPWLLAVFGLSSEDFSTWLRRHSRGGGFRTLLGLWFACAVLLQVRFVPVYARVEPTEAEFFVDGKLKKPGRLWLTLHGHKFEARPPEGLPGRQQTLELEWRDVLSYWNQSMPALILEYLVSFSCDTDGVEIVIQRKKGLFERTYRPAAILRTEPVENWDRTRLVLPFPEAKNSIGATLPYGEYVILARKDKAKCKPSDKKEFTVQMEAGKDAVMAPAFEALECPQQP